MSVLQGEFEKLLDAMREKAEAAGELMTEAHEAAIRAVFLTGAYISMSLMQHMSLADNVDGVKELIMELDSFMREAKAAVHGEVRH